MPDLDAVLNLVRSIKANNMIDAQAQFDDIMGDKVGEVLANRRVEVARSVYGPARVGEDSDAEQVEDIPDTDSEE